MNYLAAVAASVLIAALVLLPLHRFGAPSWLRWSVAVVCVALMFALTDAFSPLRTAPLWVQSLNAALIGIAGFAATMKRAHKDTGAS
jgi:hypothetical protein